MALKHLPCFTVISYFMCLHPQVYQILSGPRAQKFCHYSLFILWDKDILFVCNKGPSVGSLAVKLLLADERVKGRAVRGSNQVLFETQAVKGPYPRLYTENKSQMNKRHRGKNKQK